MEQTSDQNYVLPQPPESVADIQTSLKNEPGFLKRPKTTFGFLASLAVGYIRHWPISAVMGVVMGVATALFGCFFPAKRDFLNLLSIPSWQRGLFFALLPMVGWGFVRGVISGRGRYIKQIGKGISDSFLELFGRWKTTGKYFYLSGALFASLTGYFCRFHWTFAAALSAMLFLSAATRPDSFITGLAGFVLRDFSRLFRKNKKTPTIANTARFMLGLCAGMLLAAASRLLETYTEPLYGTLTFYVVMGVFGALFTFNIVLLSTKARQAVVPVMLLLILFCTQAMPFSAFAEGEEDESDQNIQIEVIESASHGRVKYRSTSKAEAELYGKGWVVEKNYETRETLTIPSALDNGEPIVGIDYRGLSPERMRIAEGEREGELTIWPSYQTEIIIEEGVKFIKEYAFADMNKLERVTLPDSLMMVEGEGHLFADCKQLTEVNFPRKLAEPSKALIKKMEEVLINRFNTNRMFENCTALMEVKFPAGITSISYAFVGCTAMESYTVPEGITDIAGAFDGCTELTQVNLRRGIQNTGDAFRNCTSLRSVNIPDDWSTVNCFSGSGITEVRIPPSVRTLWIGAYENCNNLTTVDLPDTVEELYYDAFRGCRQLSSVVLSSVVGDNAFSDCPRLSSVTFRQHWKNTKGIKAFENSPNAVLYCLTDSGIPEYAKLHNYKYKIIGSVPPHKSDYSFQSTNSPDPDNRPVNTPENNNIPVAEGIEVTAIVTLAIASEEDKAKKREAFKKAGYVETDDGHFWKITKDRDGNQVSFEYDENGSLLSRNKNTPDGGREVTDYTLDENGKISRTVTQSYDKNGGKSNISTVAEYNADGKAVKVAKVDNTQLRGDHYRVLEESLFDNDGKITDYKVFDTNGNLTDHHEFYTRELLIEGGPFKGLESVDVTVKTVTAFDRNGNPTGSSVVVYNPDGTTYCTTNYDVNGNKISHLGPAPKFEGEYIPRIFKPGSQSEAIFGRG